MLFEILKIGMYNNSERVSIIILISDISINKPLVSHRSTINSYYLMYGE